MRRSTAARRGAALLIDFLSAFLLILLARPGLPGSVADLPLHLLLSAALLTPFVIYALIRWSGRSFGHFALGLRPVVRSTGQRPARLYDFLFDSEVKKDPDREVSWLMIAGVITSCLTLAGGFYFFQAVRDPQLRAIPERRIPLFAPEPAQGWRVLPWYYASGAWPERVQDQPVLYALPYEKGPPHRFVGRIQSYIGRSGVRITLTGPLTLKSTGKRDALRACFRKTLGCPSLRREVFERPLAPFFKLARAEHVEWIVIDNPMLRNEERPEGLFLSGKSRNGERIEGYFLINDLMRFQGFILSRPENEEGERVSQLLIRALGSFRMTSEIEASRAWINQSLSKLNLGTNPGEAKLREAQGLLLSKISVDPAGVDPFYHLARVTFLLHQLAVQRRDLEGAASARSMIRSALKYTRDVAPENERIRELETLEVRTTPR